MYSFRLISFNIGGYEENCEVAQHWSNRAGECISILRRYDADLIGFQEVQTRNRSILDAHLEQYMSEYGLKTCHQADEDTLYNPIYWKPTRFEKLDAGGFYLSETPELWSKSWDAMHVRSATWLRLRCLRTNFAFLYANVHLDHRGKQARIESSKLIVRQLMALRQIGNPPVIISGDFNARAWAPTNENVYDYPPPVSPYHLPPGGTVHRIYTEQNFKDTYLEAGHSNQLNMNTYHDYSGNAFPPVALRLDWIMTLDGMQQLQTENHVIIRDGSPPVYASDHYPILANLGWKTTYRNPSDG